LHFLSDSELKEEKLQNLPSFLEALGFIVEEMDEVSACCDKFCFSCLDKNDLKLENFVLFALGSPRVSFVFGATCCSFD
jgi:hypothetical protein